MSISDKNIVSCFVILVILTQGQSRSINVRQINGDQECFPECPDGKQFCDNPSCYPDQKILSILMNSRYSNVKGLFTTPRSGTAETRSKRSITLTTEMGTTETGTTESGTTDSRSKRAIGEDSCTIFQTITPRVATNNKNIARFIVNTPYSPQEVGIGTCSPKCQHSNCSQIFQDINLSTPNQEGNIQQDSFSFPSKCLCS